MNLSQLVFRGHIEPQNVPLSAIPAIAYRRDSLVEILISVFENRVDLYIALSVYLALIGPRKFNISDQSDPYWHRFLRDNSAQLLAVLVLTLVTKRV